MTMKSKKGIVGKTGPAYCFDGKEKRKTFVGEGIDFVKEGADTTKKIDNASRQVRK